MKLRGKFELVLVFGKKKKTFFFEQATAYDLLEFIEESQKGDFNPGIWIYEFFNQKCTTNKPFWQKANISKKEFSLCLEDFEKVFRAILATYFRGFEQDKAEKEEESMPFEAFILLLSEKMNIHPLDLLKTYTIEQIGEFSQAFVYIENMKTEEGRNKNKAERLTKKLKQIDKTDLNSVFERLKSYHK